jgi:receptor protein-tyrosine kinase
VAERLRTGGLLEPEARAYAPAAGDAADDAGPNLSEPAEETIAKAADTAPAAASPFDESALAPGKVQPPRVPFVERVTLQEAGVVVGGKRTRISEEFRVTVTRVLRAMRSAKPGHGAPNMIMVTSAKPGEGKSFTALNLAASIAEHGLGDALLVDTDAKLRPVSEQLGLSGCPGVIDLAGTPGLRPEEVVIKTGIPRLSIVPVGSTAEARVSMSVPPHLTSVAERIGRRFPGSVVILDAAPCLSTSDPTTLAPLVGQVLMVVEAGKTQRSELEAALELVKACPNITLLLNKILLTTGHTFGAYHYYGTYA